MATVQVAQELPASVHEAEQCWLAVERWPAWVDGLARIVEVRGDWPGPGSSVTWESGPAGRGRVSERVLRYEPLSGQTVEVDDDSIRGRQTVTFTPEDGAVEVQLRLEYRLKRRSPLTPLVDLMFIRRAMAASLSATLSRFAAELAARRAGVG